MVHVIEKATIAKSFGSRATFFIFKFILDSKGSVSVTPKIPIRSLKTKCQRLHWFSRFFINYYVVFGLNVWCNNPNISFLTEISDLSRYIKSNFFLFDFLIDFCLNCDIISIELYRITVQTFAIFLE